LLCVLCIVALNSVSASAQDWPQWRGPHRDSVAIDSKLPANWPTGDLRPVWKTPVGEGYSGPVIVGGKLFTHVREQNNEVVLCMDAATGKGVWRYSYPAPYQIVPVAIGHGAGPKATTTVVGGRVYAFGISSILTCVDAATGKKVWQVDTKKDFDAAPAEYGSAGSPLVEGDSVIVPVGGKRGGSVMAFHKDTGKLAWKAAAGELPSFCSPVAADIAGVRHILTFTEKQFVGLDPKTGKVFWSHPFDTEYRQNIVTPVVSGDLVIGSGYNKFAFALRVAKAGDKLTATELWKNRDLRIYMSSPVLVGGHVYGLGAQNALVCVNIETGKTAWLDGNFGEYCSIVVAGDRLLVLSSDGELTVVRADPAAYKELGRSRLSDATTWAHLGVVGSRLFVRDARQVACFDLAGAAR
jgi:outer membrane protein assembly factor BamB